MSADRDEMLSKLPTRKLVWKLALPTICAQLINALYNVVDRIYLGHIPNKGSLVLTGVGLCMPIITLISAFAALIGAGGAPLASINWGSGNRAKANSILNQGFTALIITSLLLSSVFYAFRFPVLSAFGASQSTLVYAEEYLSVYLAGTLFVELVLGLNPFITAQGYSTYSMVTVLLGAAMNIILDPIFIFAFGMGSRGAALATILSQALSCLYVIKFLTGKKTALTLNFRQMRPQKTILMPVLGLGLSPFIMQATESAVSIAFNSTLAKTGGDIAVAAMTIISSISTFLWLPVNGFTQGAQPVISYNFGARKNDRVKEAFAIIAKVCFTYCLVFVLLAEFFPKEIIGIFTNDVDLITYATPYVRLYFIGFILFSFQIACQQTFLALGQARISMFIALLRKVILLIPLVLILSRTSLGTFGAFLAEPISDTVSALTALTLFGLNFKKILERGPNA